jgi:hypothetical protein
MLKSFLNGPISYFNPLKTELPEGRRPGGRPSKSYEDGIEETGRRKGTSLREVRRLAVDRGRWKEFVEAPLTL